jgi:hypothetical protein
LARKESGAQMIKVTSEQFIADLKQRPEYSHVNIDWELEKMDRWIKNHPGRVKTRKFVTNWLDKIEPPVKQSASRVHAINPGQLFLDSFATTAWSTLDKRLAADLTTADIRALWKHGENLTAHRKQFFTWYNLTPPID